MTSISDVRAMAGEPPAVIRVRNLQSSIRGPRDAWGRPGTTTQPLLVSVEVHMRDRFRSTSSADALAEDTVHYGLLSKALLRVLQDENAPLDKPLEQLPTVLLQHLTGTRPIGEAMAGVQQPLLKPSSVRFVSLICNLPKASLLGTGVSATTSWLLDDGCIQGGEFTGTESCALQIHGLRIPTLIGVNKYERTAKQVVAANITCECLGLDPEVNYGSLEAAVVKTVTDSTRETLEALAEDLAVDIKLAIDESWPSQQNRKLTISLEKPTAIPMAEAACVELRVETRDIKTSERPH